MRTIVVILVLFFSTYKSFSQSDSIKYTPDFKFTDGIYQTFGEFKVNTPSINHDAIITENNDAQFLFGEIVKVEMLSFIDDSGEIQKLRERDIWGYCSRGRVKVLLNSSYHNFMTVGSISILVEEKLPSGLELTYMLTETKRITYLLDFKTGEIWNYNLENFIKLIQDDQELYSEFLALNRKSKMKKQMIIFLHSYNNRNPIYFRID